MLAEKLSGGAAADVTYVDDVFSSWLRTGTGADVTTTTNIDMTKGYMIWTKGRSGATDHAIYDSARGVTYDLASNTTAAQTTQSTGLKSVSSTGYTIGSLAKMNTSSATYVDWTFRKAAKFFDVVTYTGTGSARTIAHSLGSAPGCIIVKRIDTAGNWQVYHNGLTSAAYSIQLNLTSAQASATTVWNSTAPTSSGFSVGTDATVNASGATYVAYLFAHDTSSTGLIQCGGYTGSNSDISVSLGWEPQYLLIKNITTAGNDWVVMDVMRGITMGTGIDNILYANDSGAEKTVYNRITSLDPTGFTLTGGYNNTCGASQTYIYIAIRRPNKPPTSGTQVFSPVTGTYSNGVAITTNFPVDTLWQNVRSGSSDNTDVLDRLRGVPSTDTSGGAYLTTSSTLYETTTSNHTRFWTNTGYSVAGTGAGNSTAYFAFKRAPGFFDVVCYTGTGSATTFNHNLGAVPELYIFKSRSNAQNWYVYGPLSGATKGVATLNTTSAYTTSATPNGTITTFGLDANTWNTSGYTYVAYLFATLAGISKVGSYTGNGTSQTINCGFAAGARFILIKRTDSTGDWKVIDSARGIVAGNDPTLALNSTAAEVTGTDCIDPDSSGFIVNQESTNNLNVNGATYIFLSVS